MCAAAPVFLNTRTPNGGTLCVCAVCCVLCTHHPNGGQRCDYHQPRHQAELCDTHCNLEYEQSLFKQTHTHTHKVCDMYVYVCICMYMYTNVHICDPHTHNVFVLPRSPQRRDLKAFGGVLQTSIHPHLKVCGWVVICRLAPFIQSPTQIPTWVNGCLSYGDPRLCTDRPLGLPIDLGLAEPRRRH